MVTTMENNNDNTHKLDFKSIILLFWRYKWLFAVSILIGLTYAYFHNKFSENIYENSIQMSIDVNDGRGRGSSNEKFQAVSILNETSSMENEMEKMKTFPLIKQTLTRLNYEVSYHLLETPFKLKILQKLPYRISRELYKEAPFEVHFARSHDQLINTPFFVEILSDSTYRLTTQQKEITSYNYIDNQVKRKIPFFQINKIQRFGEIFETPNFKFYLELKDHHSFPKKASDKYYFLFHHMDYLTLRYLKSLNIEPTSPTSSVLNISINAAHYRKVTEFLNQLAQVYINKDLEEKNRKAKNTIEFIESQISDVSSSLSYTGSTLEQFRSQHRIVDLDFQGQKMYETLNMLDNEKSALLTQRKYYLQIRDYINNNKVTELMAPTSMNFTDPVLNNLISQLTALFSERNNTPNNEKNLYLKNLNRQIENLKKSILENINSNLKNIDISLEDIEYRISKKSDELSALPATELKLQALQRKFELNDEIYTYLLTKHAEAQVAQASNFPSYEIIDPARNLDHSIIAPRRMLNYLIAIILGFSIPASFILMLEFFNTRIRSISDIERITNVPVIGNIIRSRKTFSPLDLNKISYSMTAESIRMLRTNIQITNGKEKKVILVTSSRSHEGKTFTSIHLAKGFSMLKKRVVLVGFDLRKPKLGEMMKHPNNYGTSTFLATEQHLDEIIQPTENEYLDLISEGPLPPNPTELIASSRTGLMLNQLRPFYDYIIIDTSPIGIVPDSKLIMKHADINLLVVRQSKTRKNELIHTLKNLESKQVNNFHIVMNDFSPKNEEYNYMYKYYSDQPQEKESKILSWFE
jgi:capsular exopolysaccharide synthesis family protein